MARGMAPRARANEWPGRIRSQFFLAPTNSTLLLAADAPPWGESWVGTSRGWSGGQLELRPPQNLADFQQTNWRALPHVLVHALARHPARTHDVSDAGFCIVAALGPPVIDPRFSQPACDTPWARVCPPSIPLVVVENADVDYPGHPICPELWPEVSSLCSSLQPNHSTFSLAHQRCCKRTLKRTIRLTGGAPGLNRKVQANCGEHTLTVPWLGHARVAPLALAPNRPRPVRIAVAMGVIGHFQANALGFTAWRLALRNTCRPSLNCTRSWVTQAGTNTRMAIGALIHS